MNDLIKALQIFAKYTNDDKPTHCEHDEFRVYVAPDNVSQEDLVELDQLSFFPDDSECFLSFRFGS